MESKNVIIQCDYQVNQLIYQSNVIELLALLFVFRCCRNASNDCHSYPRYCYKILFRVFQKPFFCCCNRFSCSLFFRLQKSPRVLKGLSFQTFEIFCVRSEASNFPATTSFLARGETNKLKSSFFPSLPKLSARIRTS